MKLGAITTSAAACALLAARGDAQAQVLGEPHGLMPAQHGGSTLDFAAADLDGDGDVDLLLARVGPDAVVLGDGSGRFDELADALPAGDATTHAAALGDVDGDGNPDAVLALDGANALLVNGGAGAFVDASGLLPPDADQSRDVLLLDADQDGALDVVVANHGVNRLYLGDGSGGFAAAPGALGGSAAASNAAVALDADLDGDPDLLFGNGQPFVGAANQLLRNDGGAVFADASALLPQTAASSHALAAGDVDADGDADVVVGNAEFFGATQELYLGDGLGGFGGGAWAAPGALNCRGVALHDVDGDGDLDAYLATDRITVGLYSGGEDRILANDGAGSFAIAAGAVPDLAEPTAAVLLLDADGDGDADALLGSRDRYLLGDGTGRLVIDADPLPHDARALSAAVADVDGDGDLDAVLGNGQDSGAGFPPGRQTLFLRNDGTGFFADETESVMPPLPPGGEFGYTWAARFADADGDGDPDLFLGRTEDSDGSGGGLYLFPNAGGVFSAMTTIGGAEVEDFALGDVDGDGDLDAFLSQFPREGLLLGDGAGAFVSADDHLPPTEADYPGGCALGDVDADGDLDALVGERVAYSTGWDLPNRLYRNDGAGFFADAPGALPAERAPTAAVALADLDADGDLDAVIANDGADLDRLYENQGAGAFTDVSAAKLPPSGPSRAIGIGDFDADGWPDLLLGGGLYRNAGGTFVDAADLAPAAGAPEWIALGDLDGDGDQDALLATPWSPPRLWRGLPRQVVRRGPPRAGQPFALELFGAPLGACVVAVAAAPADIPLPPFGTVYLDPASLLVVAIAPLGADGSSILEFPVTTDPAAVGLTLHWQGFAIPERRFTNREAVTITSW